ncbi:zinc finger CCCH domain-containing protein [Alistipes putredinis]|jgi:hypothetical protein|uniref:zinc finger CCCH domain-containing protein n=1 Tax=Alistipes putredinis TaxID=28117 RepID=UPI003AF1A838
MKKYTQADFDAFEVIDGIKQCPSGDYSDIQVFSDRCSFGEDCSFGEECSFGKWCSFGEDCSFGEYCSFGKWCSFSKQCSFGEDCSFGEECSFGEWCSFGKWCSFGEDCSFGEECSFEGKGEYIGDYPFLAFVGFGSRIGSKVYFFNLQDGIYVRCGCWLSDIAGFRERVKAKNADAMYLDLCDLVERKFNRKNSK